MLVLTCDDSCLQAWQDESVLNLSMWRGKAGPNTWSYCTTKTAKRNITSSGLVMVLVCVFVGGQGENAVNHDEGPQH